MQGIESRDILATQGLCFLTPCLLPPLTLPCCSSNTAKALNPAALGRPGLLLPHHPDLLCHQSLCRAATLQKALNPAASWPASCRQTTRCSPSPPSSSPSRRAPQTQSRWVARDCVHGVLSVHSSALVWLALNYHLLVIPK
eukprot:1147330-Pelagomonas_calceolata.AAC.1